MFNGYHRRVGPCCCAYLNRQRKDKDQRDGARKGGKRRARAREWARDRKRIPGMRDASVSAM